MKIKRLYFKGLYDEIAVPQISILLGARQVGKSTLMRQIEGNVEIEGRKVFFKLWQEASALEYLREVV